MLKSYVLLAIRNIKRQPLYTLLNVMGLTVGIIATLFILLFITEETRYENFHQKADRIHRISSDITEQDNHFRWAVTQVPLARQVREDYPEVESAVRFMPMDRPRLRYKDQSFYAEDAYYADSTLFEVFTFELINGQEETALDQPHSILLNESLAKKMFGKEDPIGKVIKLEDEVQDYQITGVFKDIPNHSHLIPDALFSINTVPYFMQPEPDSWGGFQLYTYVLLREGANAAAFERKLQNIIDRHVAVIFDQFNVQIKYETIALQDIHLLSDFDSEPKPTGQLSFLYIFGIVALLMLALASINYMNLSTARATRRATEVGIRKVLGSQRGQLILQFLSESVLFTLISLLLSYCLIPILLPFFNSAFDLQLSSQLLFSPTVLGGIFAILVLVGVLGGSYPAFFLSAFPPITVLKGTLSKSGNQQLRKALVAIQFAITIFMLIGTGIIYDQMSYLRNKDLGFAKENVMTMQLPFPPEDRAKYPILKEKLLQNPRFVNVATSNNELGKGVGKSLMNVETKDGSMEQYGVDFYEIDSDFFSTMKVPIAMGRDFSSELSTDSMQSVLVNESMVKRMGWEDPIGKRVQLRPIDSLPFLRVVGVVENFHQKSLYEPIGALMFYPAQNLSIVHARIQPRNTQEVAEIIDYARNSWEELYPNSPFDYNFVDASFMELYEADRIRAKIFTLFSLLMIFVASLGLLGLASFIAQQRTKEVGIRKILGANTKDIVFLLTKSFVLLVVIAAIPAFVLAWYFMNSWLGTFAYHTDMNYWLFALAFFIVVVLTVLTTGFHALRASKGNPVDSLRYE
ncbi:MAG: ABC transporter permease [Bacteroidota bacterium]